MDYEAQIQDALRKQGVVNQEIQQRIESQPQFEAQARQQAFSDPLLGNLRGQYSDSILQMYNYDQNRAAELAKSPLNAPIVGVQGEQLPVSPFPAMKAWEAGFSGKVQQAQDLWKMYETRKTIIGNELDKAISLYESKTKLKESERNALKDQIDSLSTMLGRADKLAQDAKSNAFRQQEIDIAKAKLQPSTTSIYSGVSDVPSAIRGGQIEPSTLSDEDAIAAVKDIYGQNVKLGTQTQAPAYARLLLSKYKTDGLDINVVSQNMDKTNRDQLLGAVKFIQDVDKVLPNLKSQTIYGSAVEGTTGPLAGIIGPIMGQKSTSKEMTTRQLIDQMRAEKIKDFYGGAFTQTEMRNANWLPGSNRQESTNITALTAMKEAAIQKIVNYLATQGITGNLANQLISQYTSGAVTQVQGETGKQLSDDEIRNILGK